MNGVENFDYPYQDVVAKSESVATRGNPQQTRTRAKARVMSFADEYDLKEIVRMSARKRVERDGVHVVLGRTGLLAKMILERHGIGVELTTDDPNLVRFVYPKD